MRRFFALALGVVAVIWLSGAPARADTLAGCLAKHHMCVTSSGRSLISLSQQDQLEKAIGSDDIYLVVAASGSAGYDSAMRQIISALGSEKNEFVVGFLDSSERHFGASNQGVLADGAAANIATTVVKQHHSVQGIFAAMQDFVRDVQQEARAPGSSGAAAGPPSHTLRNTLITLGVILLVVLGGVFAGRRRRQRRQHELAEAKAAAQDDLLALNDRITDHHNDVSVQGNPEAAAEQAAALAAYERGTAALDAARRPEDMRNVSKNIAEGQYRLACAEALTKGKDKPERLPMCFFDPRHGMSVANISWAPPDGGPSRVVPVCIDDERKINEGIQPDMRTVQDSSGARVQYVNAGFAPAYWGGFGYGGAMLGGFLLGEALARPPVLINEYGYVDPGNSGGGFFGGGNFGGGGGNDFGGGDFGGGGGFGGGGFGGGDFGGGGGGDFGGGNF